MTTTAEQLIRAQFESLSPELQRAARYLLEHPHDVALLSMREVARRVGVRPATMLRLAQRIGLKTYNRLRGDFASRLRQNSPILTNRAKDLQIAGHHQPLVDFVSRFGETEIDDLRRTFASLDANALEDAVTAILKASTVFVIGVRSPYAVAFYLWYALRIIRGDVVLLTDTGGSFGDELRDMGPRDVLVAVSFQPYSRDTVDALVRAKQVGVRTISLTDSPASPIARNSVQTFLMATNNLSFPDSIVSSMSVAQLLVALLIKHSGAKAFDRIKHHETDLADRGLYWESNGGGRSSADSTGRRRRKRV